jgi:hypothetical protein
MMKKVRVEDLSDNITLLVKIGLAYELADETPLEKIAELGGAFCEAALLAEIQYRKRTEAFAAQRELLTERGYDEASMDFIMGFLTGGGLSLHFLEEAKEAIKKAQGKISMFCVQECGHG